MIGLDVGLVRKADPASGGGRITPSFKERFGQAYDTEFQRWVDAVHAGVNVDGPDAWDGYAAAGCARRGSTRWRPESRSRSKMVDPRLRSRGVSMKIALDPRRFTTITSCSTSRAW